MLFLTKIICNNQDLPWMNCHIKNLILYKDNIYKTFARGKTVYSLKNLQNHLN